MFRSFYTRHPILVGEASVITFSTHGIDFTALFRPGNGRTGKRAYMSSIYEEGVSMIDLHASGFYDNDSGFHCIACLSAFVSITSIPVVLALELLGLGLEACLAHGPPCLE